MLEFYSTVNFLSPCMIIMLINKREDFFSSISILSCQRKKTSAGRIFLLVMSEQHVFKCTKSCLCSRHAVSLPSLPPLGGRIGIILHLCLQQKRLKVRERTNPVRQFCHSPHLHNLSLAFSAF